MQAAALVPGQRRAHHQLGALDQVAQLEQIAVDAEVGVVLLDLAPQQRDAVQRTLEQLRGIAATGVDRISIGKLTKDVRAVDYSMRVTGLVSTVGKLTGSASG